MDQTVLLAIGLSLGVFMSLIGVAYGVRMLLNPTRSARDRVAELTGQAEPEAEPFMQLSQGKPGGGGSNMKLGALARPQDESQAHLLRKKLLQAGFRSRNALEILAAVRTIAALSLPLLTYVFIVIFASTLKPVFILFWVLISAAVGYYVPSLYVDSRLQKRQEALMKPFPDALDLLVSSVEAGLGLDAAFQRVAQEIESAAPELANELQLVNHEVAAGVPRLEALRHLDDRTGLAEVNSLVNVLTQAERFGTSVARALRVHSDLVRRKRMLDAEERAAKISPKLTVAMILFIMPTIMLVLVGPAIINVARNLIPMLTAQR